MKNLIFLIVFSFSLESCVTFAEYEKQALKMRRPDFNAFVIKTNGEQINGNKIKRDFDLKILKADIFLLDGNKILESEVIAYQDGKAYYKKYKKFWAQLIREGKIDLYYFESYDILSRTGSDHFLFKKGNGDIQELSNKDFAILLQDNPEALNKYNKKYLNGSKYRSKEMNLQEAMEIVDFYNNN